MQPWWEYPLPPYNLNLTQSTGMYGSLNHKPFLDRRQRAHMHMLSTCIQGLAFEGMFDHTKGYTTVLFTRPTSK